MNSPLTPPPNIKQTMTEDEDVYNIGSVVLMIEYNCKLISLI